MAVAAETLPIQSEQAEFISRRTDDILFNVRYLAQHVWNKTEGTFATHAERDVLEQNATEIAEADIHKLGAVVHQEFDEHLNQYISLDAGTIDNARRGCTALDLSDPGNQFEFLRRAEEVVEEESILYPDVREAMRAGATKIFISPSPTHREVDIDVAMSFDYDDRTMFRLQTISPDGQVKTMQSFSLFHVPAEAWAAFLSERYATTIEPTALAVMQFCNQVLLENGTGNEILQEFIGGVKSYIDQEDRDRIDRQLDGFLHNQVELEQHAAYYAREKLQLQKEIALSLNDWARPAVRTLLSDAFPKLNNTDKQLLSERLYGDALYVDDYVAELAIKVKTLTIDNRAGLATLNEHTIKRIASSIGLDAALELAQREQAIQQTIPGTSEFMIRENEQQIAQSGVGCGGGCSVSVVDLFSSDAKKAFDAGLSGTLYSSKELDKNSKCGCAKKGRKAKVISDGSNVVCTTCGDFQTKGKRGNLKTTESQ